MRICPKCKDGYMVKSHVSGGWDCENCKYHEGRQNEMFASAYRGLRNTQRGADKQVDYYEQRLRSKSLQNINDMNTLKQLMKDPVLVQGKSYLNWCHYPLDTYQKKTGEYADEWTGDIVSVYRDQERVCGKVLNAEGPRSPKVLFCLEHKKRYDAMRNRERVRRYEEKHNHA